MFCAGTTVSQNDYNVLSIDTAFHTLFREAAAKRIVHQVAEKLGHLQPKEIESIQRHISYAVKYMSHAWLIVVHGCDNIPIFAIRNLAHGAPHVAEDQATEDRQVYKIVMHKENRDDFMEQVNYTFNVILTALLLLHFIQFLTRLACLY